MKAFISCEMIRSSGIGFIEFEIDEKGYSNTANTNITKRTNLNGDVLTTIWRFSEGQRVLRIQTYLSPDDADELENMKEDSENDFLFHYKSDTWKIAFQSFTRVSQGRKDKINMTLSVVEKLPGDGVYEWSSSSSSSSSSFSSSISSSSSSKSSSSRSSSSSST